MASFTEETQKRAKTCREMAEVLHSELSQMETSDRMTTVTVLAAMLVGEAPGKYKDNCLMFYALLLLCEVEYGTDKRTK